MNLDKLLDREDLFFTKIEEWSFTWRLLTLQEYRRFDLIRSTGQFHPHYLHMKVFQRCYEGDFQLLSAKLPMYIPTSIGRMILYLSGDCESETIKEDIITARESYNAQGVMEFLKRFIIIAYPSYTPKELDQLNRNALIKLFVEAEELLSFKHGNNFQRFDVSKITAASQTKHEEYQPIDFNADNEAIKKQVSPWGEADILEQEYKAAKLTTTQAEKLDKLPRR